MYTPIFDISPENMGEKHEKIEVDWNNMLVGKYTDIDLTKYSAQKVRSAVQYQGKSRGLIYKTKLIDPTKMRISCVGEKEKIGRKKENIVVEPLENKEDLAAKEAERRVRAEQYAIATMAQAKASGWGERPTGAFFDSFDPVVPVEPAKPFTFFGPISDAEKASAPTGWGTTPPIDPPVIDAQDDPDPCSNCGHEITEHPYTGWGEPCAVYVP
jgi:hypothetical protein